MDEKVDAFLKWFFATCANCWNWLCDTTVGFYKATGKADVDCDFGVTLILAILVLFFLGSACWSASIAACRRHNAFIHFIIGLALPWIYPIFILFAMDIKGAKAMKKALALHDADDEQALGARISALADELPVLRARAAKCEELEAAEAERQKAIQINSGENAAEETPESEWNQNRFEKMSRNADGSLAGPWNVVYGGRQVKVIHIIEAFPEMVSVEFDDGKGNTLKIRIPYSKIESWENA